MRKKPDDNISSGGSNISDDEGSSSSPPVKGPQGSRSFINRGGHNYLYDLGKDGKLSGEKTFIERPEAGPGSSLREEIDKMYMQTKYVIPPPEDLIAKSMFTEEPIRSGAPFGFV